MVFTMLVVCVLQDVSWHLLHESLFGSVSDDQRLMMYVCYGSYVLYTELVGREDCTL